MSLYWMPDVLKAIPRSAFFEVLRDPNEKREEVLMNNILRKKIPRTIPKESSEEQEAFLGFKIELIALQFLIGRF